MLALPDVKACLEKCKDRSKRLSTIKAIVYPIVVLLVLPTEQVCSAVPAAAVGCSHTCCLFWLSCRPRLDSCLLLLLGAGLGAVLLCH